MTGDLNMLMLFRDMQVAQDVGRMAELGRYDREFTCYGFMYWADQHRHYVISANDDRLYDQALALSGAGCWLTPVTSYSQLCHVPAGCEDDIAREVKITLARKLQTDYPIAFAKQIDTLAEIASTDDAVPLLEKLRDDLDGHYDRDALALYATLVEFAWQSKTLTSASHQAFQKWLAQNAKDMADDIISKDIFERTFYGFAYESAGKYRYKINANRGALFIQKQQMMQQHIATTPIISKTFWYNYTYRLADARSAFEKYVKYQMENGFLKHLESIKKLPSAIPQTAYQQILSAIQKNFSLEAQQAFDLVCSQWNIQV